MWTCLTYFYAISNLLVIPGNPERPWLEVCPQFVCTSVNSLPAHLLVCSVSSSAGNYKCTHTHTPHLLHLRYNISFQFECHKNEFDHISLQEDLNTLVNWQNEWQMGFNAKKCVTMRLTHVKKQKIFNYKLGETILRETKKSPLSRCHFD